MKHDVWADTQPAAFDLDEDRPRPRPPLLDAKVMMVDDEPLLTDLIQTYLEDEGYCNFVVTNDPRDALALLRREQPAVLLLDLMMPHLSGFAVLEAIRADRKLRFTPVIVLTASTGADSKLRALQLGATDFLSKPVDASELVLRVRNTLAFRQYHEDLVNYDPVTRLPQAEMFDRGLMGLLQQCQDHDMLALLSIRIPECQQVREGINQATADDLVKVLTRRMADFSHAIEGTPKLATLPDRLPRVGRIAADHFVLRLQGMANAEEIASAAQGLLQCLTAPLTLGLNHFVVTPTIGIAVAPGDGRTAEALRRSADLAASHVVRNGSAQFQFASPELNARSFQKLKLASELRSAVVNHELRLHYQPKIELATGHIAGVEALVRWQHPSRGLLAPGHFIALAEELGLIRQIGDWVIERACRDAADWAQSGLGALKMAVNVAKPQFVAGDLAHVLRRALFDSGLPASQLVIELTESMLMDDAEVGIGLMNEIKALGVTLSIDDFGTGYSSLSYLKRFPLDELKIDQSFIKDLPGRDCDVAIVRAVIELGHSLGMSVTAEGVETPDQLACVKELGCDLCQGFLFSRPLPPEQLVRLLRSSLPNQRVAM